jgi:hypothetical protein
MSKSYQLMIMARAEGVPSLTTATFATVKEAEIARNLINTADNSATWGALRVWRLYSLSGVKNGKKS